MGQYFKAIILNEDYKEHPEIVAFCESFEYSNGAKLMEHSYMGNTFVAAALAMISEYNGSRFVWCGDYAETILGESEDNACNICDDCEEKAKCYDYNELNLDYVGKIIVNHDKKEYIVLPKDKVKELVICPLPLLCADGNGLGGGDYFGINMKYVGRWAYDHIEIVESEPDGYIKLNMKFRRK